MIENNIINKISKLLNEKYLASDMFGNKYIEFFINPQKGELRSLRSVKFLINNTNKELVVWRYNLLHSTAVNFLYDNGFISTKNIKDRSFIVGEGEVNRKNGKIDIVKIYHSIRKESIPYWAEKYFNYLTKSSEV